MKKLSRLEEELKEIEEERELEKEFEKEHEEEPAQMPFQPKPSLKVGDVIKVKKGTKDLITDAKYFAWVYNTPFTVLEVSNEKLVFGNLAKQPLGTIKPEEAEK